MAGLIGQSDLFLIGLFATSTVLIGLMAGLFFAYSVSVVLALNTLGESTYTRVMQSVNEKILNPAFGIAFGGAIVVPAIGTLVVFVGGHWMLLHGQLFIVASLVYLVGTVGVTSSMHIPMNDAIEAWSVESPPNDWRSIRSRWTRWNHVRTVAAVVSFVLSLVATVSIA
ncbi:anthrone oxygenase family protein [Halocatena halophila]|uniref:anthrone oxygenase family protein n=1 Tax=Halocatena halophila TaxID=2814576 RepID=UPI002ECFEFB6